MIAMVAAGAGRHYEPATDFAGKGFVARVCLIVILFVLFSFIFSVQFSVLQKSLFVQTFGRPARRLANLPVMLQSPMSYY